MKILLICLFFLLVNRFCIGQSRFEGCFDPNKDSVRVFYLKNTSWYSKRIFYYRNGKIKAIEFYNDYDAPIKEVCYYETGKKREMHYDKTIQKKQIIKRVDIYWDEHGKRKKIIKDEPLKAGID